MLSDSERKILRILYNYSSKSRRMPTIEMISNFSGRNEKSVREALAGLSKERYIEWDLRKQDSIVLLEGWERKLQIVREAAINNLSYWPD